MKEENITIFLTTITRASSNIVLKTFNQSPGKEYFEIIPILNPGFNINRGKDKTVNTMTSNVIGIFKFEKKNI